MRPSDVDHEREQVGIHFDAQHKMTERRHRIYSSEIDEVILGLRLRLWYHYEKREDLTSATVAFRCYYRLINPKAGRPDYPYQSTGKQSKTVLIMVPFYEQYWLTPQVVLSIKSFNRAFALMRYGLSISNFFINPTDEASFSSTY